MSHHIHQPRTDSFEWQIGSDWKTSSFGGGSTEYSSGNANPADRRSYSSHVSAIVRNLQPPDNAGNSLCWHPFLNEIGLWIRRRNAWAPRELNRNFVEVRSSSSCRLCRIRNTNSYVIDNCVRRPHPPPREWY